MSMLVISTWVYVFCLALIMLAIMNNMNRTPDWRESAMDIVGKLWIANALLAILVGHEILRIRREDMVCGWFLPWVGLLPAMVLLFTTQLLMDNWLHGSF
ncbi:MAG: hypothetical protein KIS92_02560 [Planctomycetota bacterium]|nr:hypothetical protein [Planctomycetota bacterium]